MLAIDGLVSGPDVGERKQLQKIVRAGAGDDPVRVQRVTRADRLAQGAGRAFRIKRNLAGHAAQGLYRARRWPERGLIGRQFEHARGARRGAPAGHVSVDSENG